MTFQTETTKNGQLHQSFSPPVRTDHCPFPNQSLTSVSISLLGNLLYEILISNGLGEALRFAPYLRLRGRFLKLYLPQVLSRRTNSLGLVLNVPFVWLLRLGSLLAHHSFSRNYFPILSPRILGRYVANAVAYDLYIKQSHFSISNCIDCTNSVNISKCGHYRFVVGLIKFKHTKVTAICYWWILENAVRRFT